MNPCIQNHLQNIFSEITQVTTEDLAKALSTNVLVFDVREPQEHAQGVIAGALAIPRGVLEFNLFNLPMLKNMAETEAFEIPIYIYCASGGRSALAAHSLQQLGFKNVHSVTGGIKLWQEQNRQLIKP